MNSTGLNKLRDYWESLRNGRTAPYRAELDPRKFEDVLENMFILEQLHPDQVRVRLAGMALCEMMGMEVRGMPPEAFIDAAHRRDFSRHVAAVLDGPAVVELDLLASDASGSDVVSQMLLLPLRSDFGEVTRILGCVVAETANIRAPVNFSITGDRLTRIHPSTIESPAGSMPGFAEDATPFAPPPPEAALRSVADNPNVVKTPRRGQLRVVSGKR
ncbi:MAG: PAS domain-containing protein [Pseudomonadota bacterium]